MRNSKNCQVKLGLFAIIATMDGLKKETYRDYVERMRLVLSYIQRHLDEDVSLEALAQVACFSPFHFHRIFRGMLGESVAAHIRRLRLERAAARLKNGTWSVIDIAIEAGYESHEAFTRAFRDMFDVSPSEYRRSRRLFSVSDGRVHFRNEASLNDFGSDNVRGTDMKVEIIEMDPVRVAYVRHVGPYNECSRAWEKLCMWAGPRGLLAPGVQFLGLCYDDPEVTPVHRIRYEACITVDEDVEGEGKIGVQQLEGGPYARATHFGPYDNLSRTYSQLCGRWCAGNGYELASKPSVEIYQNSPEDTEPEDLVTDVHVPLLRA